MVAPLELHGELRFENGWVSFSGDHVFVRHSDINDVPLRRRRLHDFRQNLLLRDARRSRYPRDVRRREWRNRHESGGAHRARVDRDGLPEIRWCAQRYQLRSTGPLSTSLRQCRLRNSVRRDPFWHVHEDVRFASAPGLHAT